MGQPSCSIRKLQRRRRRTRAKTSSFYGCSAYRDRKDCNFRQEASSKQRPKNKNVPPHIEGNSAKRKKVDYERPKEPVVSGDVRYCNRCSRMLDDFEEHQHKEIVYVDPRFPTRFMLPLSYNPGEAQFFFSVETVKLLIETMLEMKVTHVLNVGCPRLHEELVSRKPAPKSFLLDIDARFNRYFPRTHFAAYNMFNHHFFEPSGRQDYLDFISGVKTADNILIVMDPPFGGMIKLLSHNLRRLFADVGGPCKTMWIFPYFLQKNILEELPEFQMLSYAVSYDNHRKFGGNAARDSPVRIFTNLSPHLVPLPQEEGYWFCDVCRKFSSRTERHCDICGKCPTSNGKEWRHCASCGVCVKHDASHCAKCGKCHPGQCWSE